MVNHRNKIRFRIDRNVEKWRAAVLWFQKKWQTISKKEFTVRNFQVFEFNNNQAREFSTSVLNSKPTDKDSAEWFLYILRVKYADEFVRDVKNLHRMRNKEEGILKIFPPSILSICEESFKLFFAIEEIIKKGDASLMFLQRLAISAYYLLNGNVNVFPPMLITIALQYLNCYSEKLAQHYSRSWSSAFGKEWMLKCYKAVRSGSFEKIPGIENYNDPIISKQYYRLFKKEDYDSQPKITVDSVDSNELQKIQLLNCSISAKAYDDFTKINEKSVEETIEFSSKMKIPSTKKRGKSKVLKTRTSQGLKAEISTYYIKSLP